MKAMPSAIRSSANATIGGSIRGLEPTRPPYVDPARLAERLQHPTPYERGASELERLYRDDPARVIPRIEEMSMDRNDPAALWELAFGYRVEEIRAALEEAFRQIGARRLVRLVMQNLVDCDPDVLDLIEEQRQAEAHRRGGGRTPPSPRPVRVGPPLVADE